jgi:hypothetical protein
MKTASTSDLSIFAARLREFISFSTDEFALGEPGHTPERGSHDDAEFNGMALVLFALQFARNPVYRRFCEARKVFPDAVTHWTQVPAAPTSAFKEFELTCLDSRERTKVFHSSGTREQRPSRHFHSVESLAVYEASVMPWFRACVAPPIANSQSQIANPSAIGYRLSAIVLTPPAVQAPHSSLVQMFEIVRRNLNWPEDVFVGGTSGDGSWILNPHAAIEKLREAERMNRPAILLGTAFSFVHLLDLLAERNLRFQLPAGSRVMETGGYKGRSRSIPKAELHALIVERLGISADRIVSEYGMSELSSQAYDGEVSGVRCQVSGGERVFHFPPWARVQVISPETGAEVADGETGLIRVFDLANVFSVMAIQTEDLAIRRGNGFELIGRALGAEPRGCSLGLASLAIADSQ